MDLLRIRDWDAHFENNRTRSVRSLRYVCMPNRQDGGGYAALLDHPRGPAHFGAWCAIAQVASRCVPRGTLVRSSGLPHTAQTLAAVVQMPEKLISEALARLTSPQIRWLEVARQEDTGFCHDRVTECHDRVTEKKRLADINPPETKDLGIARRKGAGNLGDSISNKEKVENTHLEKEKRASQNRRVTAVSAPYLKGLGIAWREGARSWREGARFEDALKIAAYLMAAIQGHTPAFAGSERARKAKVLRWAKDIEFALRLDRRTPEQLRAAIDYAHRNGQDTFWHSVLLSGAKLRARFDQLAIQAQRRKGTHSPEWKPDGD
jgi:hypothetical protein